MSVRFETLGSGHFHFLNHITPPLALSNRPLPIWALQADRVILQRGSLDVHKRGANQFGSLRTL